MVVYISNIYGTKETVLKNILLTLLCRESKEAFPEESQSEIKFDFKTRSFCD